MADVSKTTPSLTQRLREAGFEIKAEPYTDHMGIANMVIISRDGKRTQRRARKYEEALAKCAEARGFSS